MALDSIKVMPLNTRGRNTPEKRRMLLNDLKRSHSDIAFIKKTNFKHDKLLYLKNRHYPVTYHSTNPTAKSKGVSILLFSRVPWKCQSSIIDALGRYVFVKGLLDDIHVTLATIYAPKDQQATFLGGAIEKLQEFREGQLILGGYFNAPLIMSVDISSGKTSIPPNQLKRIAKALHKTQLIDVWHLQHLGEWDYTFYSPMHRYIPE